jgi:hypothetical protein
MPGAYKTHFEKALYSKDHPDTAYSSMMKEYKEGTRSFDLLYALVARQNEKDIIHDDLTEEMLNLAPADSARSTHFLAFIAEQAPLIRSKAEIYMHKNGQLFNEAWYQMPLQKRVQINGKIGARSRAKAVKEKDRDYIEVVANYIRGTYSDRAQGNRVYERTILDYYNGIHDTATYLLRAVQYFDKYLMTISVDSVLRVDSLRRAEMAQNLMASARPPAGITEGGIRSSVSFQYSPITQNYTSELNAAAWTMYTYTHEPLYTAKGIEWAKRANQFFDAPDAMDTYARLLYRAGQKKEAVEWEEKAIVLGKQRRFPVSEFLPVLAAMKEDKDRIDKY